jgi:N-acetylglutamate synthase-like GNAT family acetyltransferase
MSPADTLRQVRAFSRGGFLLARATGRLAGVHFAGWVAEAGGQVVGVAGLYGNQRGMEIDPFSVSEPYRRQGIGRALLQTCVQHAASMTVARLQAVFLEPDPAAVALLSTAGFEERLSESVWEAATAQLLEHPATMTGSVGARPAGVEDLARLDALEQPFPNLDVLGSPLSRVVRRPWLARVIGWVYNLMANGQSRARVLSRDGTAVGAFVVFTRRTWGKAQVMRLVLEDPGDSAAVLALLRGAAQFAETRSKPVTQVAWPHVFGPLPEPARSILRFAADRTYLVRSQHPPSGDEALMKPAA